MRSSLAALVLLAGVLSLLIVAFFFTEIPIEERRRQKSLKRKIKDIMGLDREVLIQVESHTLAGSDEWNRMKEGPPEETDVRATL
mmetsp:Transcript_37523/g.49343  ORF Transcript_37523/g.49343 Transcript_37523/m.49343 type:complete len:85 (-) Transcript_37523:48-302(-)